MEQQFCHRRAKILKGREHLGAVADQAIIHDDEAGRISRLKRPGHLMLRAGGADLMLLADDELVARPVPGLCLADTDAVE